MAPVFETISVFICLVLSAFFSASETALTSITPARAKQLMDERGASARLFSFWIRHPSRIISTILIGNNAVNIMASIFVSVMANRLFENHAVAIAVGLSTLLILIFGEVTPKNIARIHAEPVARAVLPFLVGCYYLLLPFSWTLARITSLLLRLSGTPLKPSPFVTQKELDYLIMLAAKEGTLSKDKGKYLASILEFSTTQVREIMIPRERMRAIDCDMDFQKLCQYITQDAHSRYPVFRENFDDIQGFLHVKDLLQFLLQGEPPDFKISRYLRRPYFVDESQLINQVLNEMKRHRVHLAIVRNETQTVVGMVTLEDILEEVVGEIEDEHDEAVVTASRGPNQGILVDGSIAIKDLKSRWNVSIPVSKSYTTLHGFIMRYMSNKIPAIGTVVVFDRYSFTIMAVADGVVERVEITKVS